MKALGNEAINEIIKLSADYLKEDAELSKSESMHCYLSTMIDELSC
jgi:hypothetical protein